MGHACEFETAMLLHLRPELVAIDKAQATYPDPGSSYLTTDLLGGSAIRTYLILPIFRPSGTLGDPALPVPKKGLGSLPPSPMSSRIFSRISADGPISPTRA